MSDVVITGLGVLSAAGRGIDATLAALRETRDGLGPLTRFDSPRCGGFPVAEVRAEHDARNDSTRTTKHDVAHAARGEDAQHDGTRDAGAGCADALPARARCVAIAHPALHEALAQAGIDARLAASAGFVLGTCTGGMPETEDALRGMLRGRPFDAGAWDRHGCARVTDALARGAGFAGPVATVSTACSSGAQAIAFAADLLAADAAEIVVAGGVDALCRLTLNGFASLLAMAPDGCRPFDVRRAGMSLGEGAAFVVLERAAHARRRGARPLARLLGHGNTCDAHHATAPEPDGRGAEAAMARALACADAATSDVGYVNAHGTGTRDNDRAEGRAMARLFGAHAPAVSSTKRTFGHTLGAAGAIEAVACVLALRAGVLPGTAGLRDLDAECGGVDVLRESVVQRARVVLSNSFGFGGNNTVLCLAAAEDGT